MLKNKPKLKIGRFLLDNFTLKNVQKKICDFKNLSGAK